MLGVAKAFDHGCVVHSIWLALAKLGCGAWIERVPTADNLADLPSRQSRSVKIVSGMICFFCEFREEYTLLHSIGAVRKEAVLDAYFSRPEAWEALLPTHMLQD